MCKPGLLQVHQGMRFDETLARRPCDAKRCDDKMCEKMRGGSSGCMHGMQLGEVDVEDMKIDISSNDHILWANNIETDNAYWSWQRSLSGLLRPVYPGQMHQIQRNLLNLVAIIDPGTLDGLRYPCTDWHLHADLLQCL